MYEVSVQRKQRGGFYQQIFWAVDPTLERAKEIACALKMFPTYRDGSREVTYSDINGEYKMYVLRLDRWW